MGYIVTILLQTMERISFRSVCGPYVEYLPQLKSLNVLSFTQFKQIFGTKRTSGCRSFYH
jgi:hypothetical protein